MEKILALPFVYQERFFVRNWPAPRKEKQEPLGDVSDRKEMEVSNNIDEEKEKGSDAEGVASAEDSAWKMSGSVVSEY